MKKIPTLYVRDRATHLVIDEITPGCEWVFTEPNVRATRKWDGSCCLVRNKALFKRYELKPGKEAPADFIVEEHDPNTGKTFGWLPVGDGPDDQWHREAFLMYGIPPKDGTYELCGPKIQGNPEGLFRHSLIPHGAAVLVTPALDSFASIRRILEATDIEGIVFYGENGKRAKIKGKDFGISRGRR